ncbi:GSCOCG00011509001-RA-CDS [Cotesia congregata]|nr:GSCOCG00011509001-RA-CDS [Cotesia congregata]
MGVSRSVAGYLVREELQRDRLEGKAGIRAWSFEKRAEEGGGGEIVRRCRSEMKKRIRAGRGLCGWEAERKDFFENRGWRLEEVESRWESGTMKGEELVNIEIRRQERERWEKILVSESNRDYKFIKEKGIPGYLKKGWSEDRWCRMARFRLGDFLKKGGRYWEEREKRLCEVCGREEETWEHVWEVCSGMGLEKCWQEMRMKGKERNG